MSSTRSQRLQEQSRPGGLEPERRAPKICHSRPAEQCVQRADRYVRHTSGPDVQVQFLLMFNKTGKLRVEGGVVCYSHAPFYRRD